MVIYPYPLFGINFMVILHVFVIKITLNCSQIITLNTNLELLTFLMNLQELIYELTFPEYFLIV